MFAMRWPNVLSNLRTTSRSIPNPTSSPSFTQKLIQSRSLCTSTPTLTPKAKNFLHLYRSSVLVVPVSIAFAIPSLFGSKKELQCATESRSYAQTPVNNKLPLNNQNNVNAGLAGDNSGEYAEEASILSIRDLSFGTVAGICVGIFIKKGLKVVAFVFGGTFVLLQYFASRSFIKIDWSTISTSYENKLHKLSGAPAGRNQIAGLYSLFSDFITAGFQSRATLLLGIALGFRLG